MQKRIFNPRLLLVASLAWVLAACQSQPPKHEASKPFMANEMDLTVGGQPVVSLSQTQSTPSDKPQILSAQIMPGRGMNIYQLTGYLPGKGVINLFASPSLVEAKGMMNDGPDDFNGNASFRIGGAILIPYANRIRGKLLKEERLIETSILGRKVKLPANSRGKAATAEIHSMHGLILGRKFDSFKYEAGPDQASLTGTLDAGDFQGHWLSKTRLDFSALLKRDAFRFEVIAKNTGSEPVPIGIGWHPYFSLPSGNRQQARMFIPAQQRAEVNNYDDVFPTGKLLPVKNTPYDFSVPGGAPLNQLFLDDCFVELARTSDGAMATEIIDPAAKYGIRIKALSREMSAVQVYAPVDKSFIALEPQFNWADPYSKVWGSAVNTGMVVLEPGQSVSYKVELELFVP